MSRLLRIVAAITFLVGVLSAQRLAFPGGAFACSCAAPGPAAPAFSGEEQAVFIGTAGQPQPDGTYRFSVERWFKGGNAAEVNVASEREPMPDGAVAINTCGLHFEVGDRLIMAAAQVNGVYHPGLCSPHAAMNTEEGARLLNAAVAAFGQGGPPGQVPDPRDTMPDDPDLAGLALGIVGILVLLVVVSVVVAARRRREGEPVA